MSRSRIVVFLPLLFLAPATAFSQTATGAPPAVHSTEMPMPMAHDAPEGTATWKGDQGPVSRAFAEANMRMHEAMDIEYTGEADVDFARAMIAHHTGAIDMARIELDHGSDPEMRKLAEDVIAAQSEEIEFLREWLARKAR